MSTASKILSNKIRRAMIKYKDDSVRLDVALDMILDEADVNEQVAVITETSKATAAATRTRPVSPTCPPVRTSRANPDSELERLDLPKVGDPPRPKPESSYKRGGRRHHGRVQYSLEQRAELNERVLTALIVACSRRGTAANTNEIHALVEWPSYTNHLSPKSKKNRTWRELTNLRLSGQVKMVGSHSTSRRGSKIFSWRPVAGSRS